MLQAQFTQAFPAPKTASGDRRLRRHHPATSAGRQWKGVQRWTYAGGIVNRMVDFQTVSVVRPAWDAMDAAALPAPFLIMVSSTRHGLRRSRGACTCHGPASSAPPERLAPV